MAHSGKSIYYAKEFLRIYGEDFNEDDLNEYRRISPIDGYSELGWEGFIEALNSILVGDDLKTKYKPVWVPDEESARKVADLYGFKRKGHVVDPGVYEGIDKYPNGKTTRAAFFRLMGYPDRHGHTYIYSNYDNDKHISIVYNLKNSKGGKGVIGTTQYYKPYFVFEKLSNGSANEAVDSPVCESLEDNGWSKPFDWQERYTKDGYSVYKIESPVNGWHVEKSLPGNKVKHFGNYSTLERAKRFVDDMVDKDYIELNSTEGAYKQIATEEEPYWEKCWLIDAEIDNLDSEISELMAEADQFNPVKAHDHNPGADEKYFKIMGEISKLLKYQEELREDYKKARAEWKAFRESKGLDVSSFEAYAVIKTAAPFGAKSFTVVGDKATAARVAKIKNKTVEDDDKHTYIYRKMDEVNSEKYNIPVNEGVGKMKGLVDKLLALGGESPVEANENYADARPNSNRLLSMISDDVVDTKALAEELINWMSDDEVGRFAKEYEYFPEVDSGDEGDLDSAEEALPAIATAAIAAAASGAGSRLVDKVFEGAEGDLTEKEEEVLEELPPEQPVEDSQALDEKEGKPTKSATEKNSVYEGYDETEKELFEAMNRNSITDFQASVSDSISRIGSLGTIQLLLDSGLADSFEDELFFIKNTYDLSDTQLVSQAILDAGETLLEDGELERAMETLKNSSEEENEEEFGEYEEPEDWSEVDQVEEETVEEEPIEGEELTEEGDLETEETDLDEEENI